MLAAVAAADRYCRPDHSMLSQFNNTFSYSTGTSQVAPVVKNPPANAGDLDSIPGWGGSPGEGNGNPLQYSCLENPMDRGAWRAAVLGVPKSDITERMHTHTYTHIPSVLRSFKEFSDHIPNSLE